MTFHKEESKLQEINYPPISMLMYGAKLLRIMNNQLNKLFEKHSLFINQQFGVKHSTIDTLADLNETIRLKNKKVLNCFKISNLLNIKTVLNFSLLLNSFSSKFPKRS